MPTPQLKRPTPPLQVENLLVFGARNQQEAWWAYHQVESVKQFYPNGFKQLTLNYNTRRQLIAKPA